MSGDRHYVPWSFAQSCRLGIPRREMKMLAKPQGVKLAVVITCSMFR